MVGAEIVRGISVCLRLWIWHSWQDRTWWCTSAWRCGQKKRCQISSYTDWTPLCPVPSCAQSKIESFCSGLDMTKRGGRFPFCLKRCLYLMKNSVALAKNLCFFCILLNTGLYNVSKKCFICVSISSCGARAAKQSILDMVWSDAMEFFVK